jgi:hypothetical protein
VHDQVPRAGTAAAGGNRRWETYTASAIGADHLRTGKPNEDAVAAERFELPDSSGMLAFAVADGHGHARHFRSDRGSRFAVAAGLAAARAWAGTTPPGMVAARAGAGQLVADLVARWQQAVAADLAADPVDGAHAAAIRPGDPAEIPYGATLLLAVVRAEVAVLAQIGDGDMVLVRPDGRHLAPVPEDVRLDGTQTTSLCQPGATSAFRVALVNLAKTPAFAIFAATDGYGNAQADENWRPVMAADLVNLGLEHGTGWLGGRLSEWAARCASSDGSGDDTTVVLALNQAVMPGRGVTATRRQAAGQPDDLTRPVTAVLDGQQAAFGAAGPAAQPEPVFAAPPAPAWMTLRWLAGALVIAVIAVVIFLLLRSPGPAPAQPGFSPAPSPPAHHKKSPAAGHQKSPAASSTNRRTASQAPNPAGTSASRSVAGPTTQK